MQSWIALLIAVTATAIGYGVDAGMGHKELTHIFAGFYIVGCLAAVLAVRQDGIFTAVIQPPLILFVAVPGAYWLFHDGKVGKLKDLLINCGYPLIERFPLMLGTAGGVLLIGMARWYFGMSQRPASASGGAERTADKTARATPDGVADLKSFFSSVGAKLQSIVSPDAEDDEADAADARRGSSARARRSTRGTRADRSATRSARSRSRHARPGHDDGSEPAERPRRSSRRTASGTRDYGSARDASDAPRRPRRRPRPGDDADATGQPSRDRDARREPRTRRSPYERPTEQSYERPSSRGSRFDGYDTFSGGYGERYGEGYGPSERSSRYDDRDRPEATPEPRRRRPSPSGSHHPISQVRYRGSADTPNTERRGRSRTPGRSQARPSTETWEYDA